MQYKDYYNVLGVEKGTAQQDIKKAYRKLAKKYHPDAHPGDKKSEDKFKEINEAYEVLGDVEKRKKYDQLGQTGNFANGYDFDPSQYGYNRDSGYGYSSGGANNFSDFFNMFFGNSSFGGMGSKFSGNTGKTSRFSRRMESRGRDIEADIEITPEDGFNGSERMINLKSDGGDLRISFKVPKGIKEGEKIKLSGQGRQGMNGGENGDLFLKISFSKGTRYEIDGMNLQVIMDLYPWEAALGVEKPFNTMDGKIVVKTPAGIQSDNRIRVAGKGYIARDGTRGDLYIKVRIVNPNPLTPGQRDLYERLRDDLTF